MYVLLFSRSDWFINGQFLKNFAELVRVGATSKLPNEDDNLLVSPQEAVAAGAPP